jgi:hypothetical protein
MTAQQLPLFAPEQGNERGRVWREGDRWVATIDGGYWMAYGKTQQDAVKNAQKKYAEEVSYVV